jgi:hypothetical protein
MVTPEPTSKESFLKWFGTPWGPICDIDTKVCPPVGRLCAWCQKVIRLEDQGVMILHVEDPPCHRPWHLDCLIDHVLRKPLGER